MEGGGGGRREREGEVMWREREECCGGKGKSDVEGGGGVMWREGEVASMRDTVTFFPWLVLPFTCRLCYQLLLMVS